MAPNLRLNSVAFISPQNQPILIRTFSKSQEHPVKYHYIAHTSLDVIEERLAPPNKTLDSYLGLLYSMDDVAVYGYITPLRVKIVLALALSDSVVKDIEVNQIFKALHMAYYKAVSNPFLRLDTPSDSISDLSPHLLVGKPKWKTFSNSVDEICALVGNATPSSS